MEIGSWVRHADGSVRKVVDVAPGGVFVAIDSDPDAWRPLDADLAPWVPKVGERVRVNAPAEPRGDGVVTSWNGSGTVRLDGDHRPLSYGPSVLSPVLDASGRPVVAQPNTVGYAAWLPGTKAHDDLAAAFAAHPPVLSRPAYAPRVGDLVAHGPTARACKVVAVRPADAVYAFDVEATDDATVNGPVLRVEIERGHWKPLRPAAVGQRVRRGERGGWAMDSTPEPTGTTRVQFDGCGFWETAPTESLVRTASYKDRLAANPPADPSTRGRFVVNCLPDAPGVAEAAARVHLAKKHAAAGMERAIETLGPMPGSEIVTQPRGIMITQDDVREWNASVAERPASPIAARHAGHCPTCHKATRAKGETRTAWWLCGCPVEVEGEESTAIVNGEPREVFVWGGGTFGDGWTRDEALADWREDLACCQRVRDEGGSPHDNTAMARAEYRRLRVEREKAAATARSRDESAAALTKAYAEMVGNMERVARGDYGEVGAAAGRAFTALTDSTPNADGTHSVKVEIGGRRG